MEVIVELLSTFVRVLVVVILFGTVFYWIGWSVCKVITFGRYPRFLKPLRGNNMNTQVSLLGVVVFFSVFLSFIYWG